MGGGKGGKGGSKGDDDDDESMIGGYHYVGGMKDGLRHGYGKIKWLDDNTSYEGDWSHGYPLMEKKENRIMDGNDSQAGEIVIPKMNKMFTAKAISAYKPALP